MCIYMHIYIYIHICIYILLYTELVCLFVCLSVCLSLCPSVRPSVHLSNNNGIKKIIYLPPPSSSIPYELSINVKLNFGAILVLMQ